MSESEERAQHAEEKTQERQALITSAQIMHESGDSNAKIAERLGVPENEVRKLVINWRHNCLTVDVHDGRPEALWNLPLFQAAYMYPKEELKELVLARIFNDAMQFVDTNPSRFNEEWAEKVRAHAEEMYMRTLQHKIGEISTYYQSPEFQRDVKGVVERVQADRLNAHYAPLHNHDSINMLCRIIGVSSTLAVS